MLQLVEPFEVVGVAFALLQPVEHGELPADQALAAAREVREDVVHAAPQQRLLAREPHGRRVDGVERPRDLPDLLVGVHSDRLDVHVRDPAVDDRHPVDRRGQPGAGDLEGRRAQRAQRDAAATGPRHTSTTTVSTHEQRDQMPSRSAAARALAASAAPSVASCCCCATSTSRISPAVRLEATFHSPATVGRGSSRAIAVSTRCSTRWRVSTSAPATVGAYRFRATQRRGVELGERRRHLRSADRAASWQRGRRRPADQHRGERGVLAADLLLGVGDDHRVGRRA